MFVSTMSYNETKYFYTASDIIIVIEHIRVIYNSWQNDFVTKDNNWNTFLNGKLEYSADMNKPLFTKYVIFDLNV